MLILVVDDDKTMREELSELLTEEGHQASTANNGERALEQLRSKEFQVVFTDLKMPKMNGLELLREIRRLHPGVYAVMVTGYATVETAVEALKMGAFDYLQKPFRIEQVKEILKRIGEERKFRGPWSTWPSEPSEVLLRLQREGGNPLVFSAAGAFPGVQTIRLDPSGAAGTVSPRDLHRIRELATMHAAKDAGKPVILIDGVEALVEGHSWADVRAMLEAVRASCVGNGGTLLLTLDPARLTQTQVEDLRKLTGEPFASEMVDSLTSPIRRDIIRRLQKGPATFSEVMRAAGIDDSPKLTFHLKKLVQNGTLMHSGERYGLADKGARAARFLAELETEGAMKHFGQAMLFERAK